jgi:hypothetical protein
VKKDTPESEQGKVTVSGGADCTSKVLTEDGEDDRDAEAGEVPLDVIAYEREVASQPAPQEPQLLARVAGEWADQANGAARFSAFTREEFIAKRLDQLADGLFAVRNQLAEIGQSENDNVVILLARLVQYTREAIRSLAIAKWPERYREMGFALSEQDSAERRSRIETALRKANNQLRHALASITNPIAEVNARAEPASVLRDRIAKRLHFKHADPEQDDIDHLVTDLTNMISAEHDVGSAQRFLPNARSEVGWNKQELVTPFDPLERQARWEGAIRIALERADLQSPESCHREAERVVIAVACGDGFPSKAAHALFERKGASKQGKNQRRLVRSPKSHKVGGA